MVTFIGRAGSNPIALCSGRQDAKDHLRMHDPLCYDVRQYPLIAFRFGCSMHEKPRICPSCRQPKLYRIHRRWYHRIPSLIGLPLHYYACAACKWRGLRRRRRLVRPY
jgi:hypothetical protein